MKYFLAIILVCSIFSCKRNTDDFAPSSPKQVIDVPDGIPPSFEKVDKNKDGKITFYEYESFPIIRLGEDVKKSFDIEDKNKDGFLDSTEFGKPHWI